MGILNRLFGSKEAIAKEMKLDDEAIKKSWDKFVETISKEKPIIERLRVDNSLNANLQELKRLQEIELVDIRDEEKDEEELISDLEWMEHSQRIEQLHKLERCLGYAKTKYEYVYELLHELGHILTTKMHLTENLLSGSKDPEKLISHLKSQFELEWTVVKKILSLETFHELFSALVKGEHMIKTLNSKEKVLLRRMQKIMYNLPPEKREESIIRKWTGAVYDAIYDKAKEAYEKKIISNQYYSKFEFVNQPIFVDLVREKIRELKGKELPDEIINAFVHMFREWYNYELEE